MSLRYVSGNIPAPGANTGIMSSGLVPTGPGFFRVEINPSAASVIKYTAALTGSTTISGTFNSGIAISSGRLAAFELSVDPRRTYNVQVQSNTVIRSLVVTEELLP